MVQETVCLGEFQPELASPDGVGSAPAAQVQDVRLSALSLFNSARNAYWHRKQAPVACSAGSGSRQASNSGSARGQEVQIHTVTGEFLIFFNLSKLISPSRGSGQRHPRLHFFLFPSLGPDGSRSRSFSFSGLRSPSLGLIFLEWSPQNYLCSLTWFLSGRDRLCSELLELEAKENYVKLC